MAEHLRVAVSGCHRMLLRDLTHHNFAAAFNDVAETEVVGVFDYGEDTRAEFVTTWPDVRPDVPTFDDYDRMVGELKPDIVCIATRQTMHADQVEAASGSGVRGVLCDKPLVTTLEEMDRLLSACGSIPLCFALDRRWDVSYRHICSHIDEWIGPVTSAVAYGLPNTINHGCHWYDALLGLIGDPTPEWVSGHLNEPDPDNERSALDPSSRAVIGFDNGLVAHITSDGGKGPTFHITGENGKLSIQEDGKEAHVWREGSGVESLSVPVPEIKWPTGPAMVADLVKAVQDGERTSCDVDQARRATEIGFAIHHSSRENGARVALADVDRSLRVESYPWGNEA